MTDPAKLIAQDIATIREGIFYVNSSLQSIMWHDKCNLALVRIADALEAHVRVAEAARAHLNGIPLDKYATRWPAREELDAALAALDLLGGTDG